MPTSLEADVVPLLSMLPEPFLTLPRPMLLPLMLLPRLILFH
jgi:hypothetical protein